MRTKAKKPLAPKVLLVVCCLLLAVSTGFLIGIGNYFYNFALNVQSDQFIGSPEDVNVSRALELTPEQTWFSSGEAVNLQSWDGLTLNAYQFFSQPNHNYVIVCHGYQSRAEMMAGSAYHFFEMGFNLLVPDARGHGLSEGDYVGMGWHDRLDVISWCNYIIQQDSRAQIILYGISMGGATVMMAAGESSLPEEVKLVIEDCGYTSVWDEFSEQLDEMFGLPSFPILNVTSLVTKTRAGWWLGEASALEQIKKCTIPVFFIHGEKDTFVPFEMVQRLYMAATCPKRLYTVPDAEHAQSSSINPDRYWRNVTDFIAEYLEA